MGETNLSHLSEEERRQVETAWSAINAWGQAEAQRLLEELD